MGRREKVASLVDIHVQRFIRGKQGTDYNVVDFMTAHEKLEASQKLLSYCFKNIKQWGRVERILSRILSLIPHVPSAKRYHCLSEIMELLLKSHRLQTRDIYNVLDFSVVESLQPLEILTLANTLADQMNQNDDVLREASLWGLIRLIPHMHSVNQREYAHDVFYLHRDFCLRGCVLEALTTLIFSMDQEARAGMIFFFADILKENDCRDAKYFTLHLLQCVTASLPEGERVLVADVVLPLVYFSDIEIVKRAVDFFAVTISLLPQSERGHYTQVIAGLINDLSVKPHVVNVLERALPFLSGEDEREHFRELLDQYHSDYFYNDRRDKDFGEVYCHDC
ncbi:MAG: hypothetical protein HQM16_07075 [Deltaproteobacteria bacterium]|nr:hypothetical protein [Deltaproteobacteria bacterium]